MRSKIGKRTLSCSRKKPGLRTCRMMHISTRSHRRWEVALKAVMGWAQTTAVQKSNQLKEKKAERASDLKTNTAVKMVDIKAGKDDATTQFHPQRFLRPPVVAPEKYWNLFPKSWGERYYSVYLEDVGLQNDLGQKQIELLHDRRSALKIKMFTPSNVNVGRGGTRTTNVRNNEDGDSLDLVSKDEWTKLASLTDLELALDNLVAAYACFWPGDRSMVTLRRVVTKTKSFGAISNQENRLKMLEIFINQILEINQRKAVQDEVPMTFKEMMDVQGPRGNNDGGSWKGYSSESRGGGKGAGSFSGGRDRSQRDGGQWTVDAQKDQILRILKNQKIQGKELCIEYNVKAEDGAPMCKSRNCRKAHNCAFVQKGESKACGQKHSKVDHFKLMEFKKEN